MQSKNLNNIDEAREFLEENEKYKAIVFKFDEGKGLPNHTHNGYANIQILQGKVDITFKNNEHFELSQGDYLPFDARIEHNVIAKVPSKVLVTIIK